MPLLYLASRNDGCSNSCQILEFVMFLSCKMLLRYFFKAQYLSNLLSIPGICLGISGSPTQDNLLVKTGQTCEKCINTCTATWQSATNVAGHPGQAGVIMTTEASHLKLYDSEATLVANSDSSVLATSCPNPRWSPLFLWKRAANRSNQ